MEKKLMNIWRKSYLANGPWLFSGTSPSVTFYSITMCILEARELPVLSMLEKIKCQLMTRFYSKDKECAEKWTGNICPKIKKKKENQYIVDVTLPAGRGVFQVTDKEHQYIVDVTLKQCDCRH